ncbi:hypothetical protein FI667_g15547, partial [Globisporangium splendens]
MVRKPKSEIIRNDLSLSMDDGEQGCAHLGATLCPPTDGLRLLFFSLKLATSIGAADPASVQSTLGSSKPPEEKQQVLCHPRLQKHSRRCWKHGKICHSDIVWRAKSQAVFHLFESRWWIREMQDVCVQQSREEQGRVLGSWRRCEGNDEMTPYNPVEFCQADMIFVLHLVDKRCVVPDCGRPSYERTGNLRSVHFAETIA